MSRHRVSEGHAEIEIYCGECIYDQTHKDFTFMIQRGKSNQQDVLRDLVPFVQFKKLEKHPWKSVTFSKVTGFSLQLY